MIEGVKVEDLRVLPDDRGYLMEMFRSDSPDFEKFGQVYMTVVYPGVVKAWHYHKKQIDKFVCVAGMAKVALYDPREGGRRPERDQHLRSWVAEAAPPHHPSRRLPRVHGRRAGAGVDHQHPHGGLQLREPRRIPPALGRPRDRLRLDGDERMKILVCGGSGFIGSNFIRRNYAREGSGSEPAEIVNLDKLTYAGNPDNLRTIEDHPRYQFVHGDICDADTVRRAAEEVDAIVNLRPRLT
jgi:hypothetical protein